MSNENSGWNAKPEDRVSLGAMIGKDFEDKFEDFDMTVVQGVLRTLGNEQVIDIAHSEFLQQKALYAADLLIDYSGRLVKMVTYLEGKITSVKNKVALEYENPNARTTADAKKSAGESSPIVEELNILLAKAKGSKILIDRKYDLLLKSFYFYKEISNSQKRSMGIAGQNGGSDRSGSNGWE